jgi:ABC-type antimicrobial peptide transport system permease subunit
MLKNYFKTAIRTLWRNSSTSVINLFGLSVGMTAAVFIFLWVQSELTANDYHPDKDNIYRITSSIKISDTENWVWEAVPMLMAPTAAKEIPAVTNTSRLIVNTWGGPVLKINQQLYSEKTTAVIEKNWFDLFHYDFIEGNATAFSSDPFSIVLTESKAKKYFGRTEAVGKIIKVDSVNYTVQGVVKDNPVNSSFQFDIMMQLGGRLADANTYKNDKTWNNFTYITFLKLRPDAKIISVTNQLNDLLNKNRTNHNGKVSIRPLKDIYFEDDLQTSELPHGNKKTTYIFCLLGLLLLITACINYVNLTTAKASLRAKEVSVRKIIGAHKSHLFFQFIAESVVISFVALLITLILLQLCLPLFNSITEKQFVLPLTSGAMWQVLLLTLLFTVVLNGIYPAVLLASFQPLNVFRGKSLLTMSDAVVRKGLVVFQFSLSMMLIIGSIVIYRQLNFIQNNNPGYKISQVMSVQLFYRSYAGFDQEQKRSFFSTLQQQLQSKSSILQVSNGSDQIMNVTGSSSGNADWAGRDTAFNPTIAYLRVDTAFKSMFSLQMKTGEWFSAGQDEHNYIINETAAEQFNIAKPVVGQRFIWGEDTGRVIGIVKDFHYKSMHEKIGPMVIANARGTAAYFFIKTAPGNLQKAIKDVGAVWAANIPNEPFEYNFLDDSFNELYKTDIKTSKLMAVFSVIAIIIAALGLFGLATFTTEQRTKEIGIRKVLGASVQQITNLLSKDFILLVLLSIVLASPIAWWLMNLWLQDFAYKADITWWIFAAAGFLSLMIALFAVGFQAVKAALANPVKSLRTE